VLALLPSLARQAQVDLVTGKGTRYSAAPKEQSSFLSGTRRLR
jgi:hypothetical protein